MDDFLIEMQEAFLQEAGDSLDRAENLFVKVEGKDATKDDFDSLKRIYHNLKGSGRVVNFDHFSHFCHEIENLIVALDIKSVKSTTVQLLLECNDLLRGEIVNLKSDPTKFSSFSKYSELLIVEVQKLSNIATSDISIKGMAGELLLEIDKLRAEDSINFFGEHKEFIFRLTSFLNKTNSTNSADSTQIEKKLEIKEQVKIELKDLVPLPELKKEKKTMRVDEQTIDTFLNYTGELVSSSESFSYIQEKLGHEKISPEVLKEFKNATEIFSALSQGLQKSIMEIRKLPLISIFSKYPRLIRDLSNELQKKVTLKTIGEELCVDKSIIELIDDPLVHMLRNSMDHGFELPSVRVENGKTAEGRLVISALLDESFLHLKIKDDGRGIDPEKVKISAIQKGLLTSERASTMTNSEIIALLYTPGFSTAEKVSDVSGRGVGMDVVLSNIKKANGTVDIFSDKGRGTEIHIKIPLVVTTIITKALIVQAIDEQFILLLEHVQAIEEVNLSQIFLLLGDQEAINFRGKIYQVIRLTKTLFPESISSENIRPIMVLIEVGDSQVALIVDRIIGIQQVALKKVEENSIKNSYLKEGAILRNGKVAILLDVKTIVADAN